MGKLHKYISIKAKAKHTHVHTTEHRANKQKDHLQQQQSRHNQKKEHQYYKIWIRQQVDHFSICTFSLMLCVANRTE